MTRKEIEAAIKPEFMTKLKKLRIKIKFLNNIVNPKWKKADKKIELFECLNTNYWDDFILHSFNWENSPEGHDFWENISNK